MSVWTLLARYRVLSTPIWCTACSLLSSESFNQCTASILCFKSSSSTNQAFLKLLRMFALFFSEGTKTTPASNQILQLPLLEPLSSTLLTSLQPHWFELSFHWWYLLVIALHHHHHSCHGQCLLPNVLCQHTNFSNKRAHHCFFFFLLPGSCGSCTHMLSGKSFMKASHNTFSRSSRVKQESIPSLQISTEYSLARSPVYLSASSLENMLYTPSI